ncbi:MAG: bifunctional protein FolC [Lachnospiraceae bacterium]|nr:bifunctional protein FolC [Lachnospiraceae bacterium]
MNRAEAEDFIYRSYMKAERFQDYEAKDRDKRRPDLTRDLIRERAGTPCAIVTGSKGKGSVAAMISCILQTVCRVGLMTSPHIADFCERFRVNNEKIPDERFADIVTRISPLIEAIDSSVPESVCISPIGIQTLVGLEYFNEERTCFNILECGKGAEYDDVNNTLHRYAVINSIFPEHTRELGDTAEEIAEDKAHVITGEQACVYTALQTEGVLSRIRERAERFGTPLKVYGKDFWAENISYQKTGMRFDVRVGDSCFANLSIPLLGEHQARNCALALALSVDVIDELNASGIPETGRDLDPEAVRKSLPALTWPGRMEVIGSDPLILLDACINPASCQNVKDVLRHLGIRKASVVVGIPDDKDYAGVVREMAGVAERVILTRSQNPHYIFTDRQADRLEAEGIHAAVTKSVREALDLAGQYGDDIVILGTTSVIAEIKAWGRM